MRAKLISTVFLVAAWMAAGPVLAQPLAERYLLDGKLAEGGKALQEQLQKQPADDQARFGLGVVQFLQAFEHLGISQYQYGLRSERAFPGLPAAARDLLPQNPNPQKISYQNARRIVQTLVDDLGKVEETLSAVKDEAVKLPLHLGLIKLDIFGLGRPINASFVFGRLEAGIPRQAVEEFVIAFDRGDVCWLRGYCHFLSALCEVALAVDGQELFDCTAHLFYENVDSPHLFLQEEPRALDGFPFDRRLFSDAIAFIHLWRFPIKEPQRMRSALAHLEAMLTQAKEMWTHYLAETDDDHEWIPNPKQTGVLQVAVSQEMLDAWLATLDEADLVLQGKRLAPFWRGADEKRGVNVRKIFTEPRSIDPILWIQGTAATPYLENGAVTKFADPRMLRRLDAAFGGPGFFGFAFWFN